MVRVGVLHVEEASECLLGLHGVCAQQYCETLQSQNYPLRRNVREMHYLEKYLPPPSMKR